MLLHLNYKFRIFCSKLKVNSNCKNSIVKLGNTNYKLTNNQRFLDASKLNANKIKTYFT